MLNIVDWNHMSSYRRCIMILADGACYHAMSALFNQGKLPHLRSEFIEKGSFLKGVTVFPSTTGPAYMPYLSGYFPGTCHVPGIRWFDKSQYAKGLFTRKRFRSYVGPESLLMDYDFNPELATLFQLLPESYNIYSSFGKGAKYQPTRFNKILFWYYCHLTDRWDLADRKALQYTFDVVEKDFDFLFVVFPGIDEFSHLSSPNSEGAAKAYEHFDQDIGSLVEKLKQTNKYDDTLLCIVSDHGLSPCPKHFGVAEWLEARNYKTFYYPKILKRNFKMASMVSGNGMNHIYVKGKQGWGSRLTYAQLQAEFPELIAGLLAESAVDVILCEEEDRWVRIISKRGEARVRENKQGIQYQVISQDPLALPKLPDFMDDKVALKFTIDSDYPDALVQAAQLFRSSRTGDIVLSAAKGHDLRLGFEHPEHQSGHGALHNEHMLVPIMFNHKFNTTYARSVDVFNTVLHHLGKPVPTDTDGTILQ